MEGAVFLSLFLALAIAAPMTVLPEPEPEPGPLPQLEYVSELSRAGLKPELFNRPVKPKANLVGLFSTKDYPLDATRKSESGTVAVVLKVGADGRIMDCIVTASSGSPSLDAQTCRIFWQRARFVPARDSRGRPVESAWQQRINWELPESDPPTPIDAWSTRLTIEFVKEGGVVDCRLEGAGALKVDGGQGECGFAKEMWEGVMATLRLDAGYERGKLVFDTQFAPEYHILPTKAPEGTRLLSRQVVRLTIDASGKTLQCRIVETEGAQTPGGCDDLLETTYAKPKLQAGAIEATMARAVYASE
jgi:TonB family protein